MSDPAASVRDESRTILHTQHESWREVVTGLSPEALNWKPGDDTNSIAVLASHALDAERFAVAAAVDTEIPRDREAKFRVTASNVGELLSVIDEHAKDVDGYLDKLTGDHLSQEVARGNRTRTGSWWLLHAIEHSREHVGQAYLTRQLYEQKG